MKTTKTIPDENILKMGTITVKKIEGYKTIWEVEFKATGTKEAVYFNVYRGIIKQYRLLNDEKVTREVTGNNIKKSQQSTDIACSLIIDNMDWITNSLCNKTKTKEYTKLYGGYSKGCYELTIKVI